MMGVFLIYIAIGSVVAFLSILLLMYVSRHAQEEAQDDEEMASEADKAQHTCDLLSSRTGGEIPAAFFIFLLVTFFYPFVLVYLFLPRRK